MSSTKKQFLYFIISVAIIGGFVTKSWSQLTRPAVSGWNSYLPYKPVIDFDCKEAKTFYCVSSSSFFTYNAAEGVVERYSKSNGMNDVGTEFVTYDVTTDKTSIIYSNGNIDLFQNGRFENIPDIKVATQSGDKTIYDAFAHSGLLYISAGQGLIVVDLTKKEIKETIPFFNGTTQGLVKSTSRDANQIFVASNLGLFRTTANNPQSFNYATWDKLSSLELDFLSQMGNEVYVASSNDLYKVVGNGLQLVRTTQNPILGISATEEGDIWLMTKPEGALSAYSVKISKTGGALDSIPGFFTFKMLDQNDGYYWGCDGYAGLRRKSATSPSEAWQDIYPDGPFSAGASKVWAKNGYIWLAHGGRDYNKWYPTVNTDGFSSFRNDSWRNWKWDINALQPASPEYLADAIDIVRDDEAKETWVGMYYGGLIKVSDDDKLTLFKWGYLGQNTDGDTASYRVTGVVLDDKRNLWITQSQVLQPLRVKTVDGQWINYTLGGIRHLASLAIDDIGQKWMAVGNNMTGGLVIFNDNNTLEDKNDDKFIILRKGEGVGNLPSDAVNTIAKDKDGTMWIGTESGIGIVSCIGNIQTSGICDATLRPLVSKGFNFANYMFDGVAVKSIAIDAGNRKWIGTNAGLFLLSADGESIVEAFNESNSPLLSNLVINVSIDPITGVVYISTDKGLCSFGGSAVEAPAAVSSDLFVFPNPVPSGFGGMISIKGMTAASNVKITDINGQLVFQGTSNGGQFSWNGKDYLGRKVQSGVYLVFVVGKDGLNKATGKFIIQE